jgi:hypothetical protein
MRVVTALDVPSEEDISHYSGSALPNQQFSSDHISLCFDMVLGQPQQNIPEPQVALPVDGYAQQQQQQMQQQLQARAMMQTMHFSGGSRAAGPMASSRLGAASQPYVPRSDAGAASQRFG